MKIIVMGTGPFAVPTFRSLIPSHEVTMLVTRPTVAVKRGKQPVNPMRDYAIESGLHVLEPAKVNDESFVETLRQLAADLFVVCDYGQILSSSCLSASRLGGINLHGSLLPKYRGAAPVNWPIYFGEETTGVSVIHMTPKLDGGPVLSRVETMIGKDETAAELEPRLAEMGVGCVHEAIKKLGNWNGVEPIGETQDSAAATPARRLRKSDGKIDWTRTADEIRNQVRAFQPWPASYTFWQRSEGKTVRLILHQLDVVVDSADPNSAADPDSQIDPEYVAGRVVHCDGKSLWIATGRGCLAVRTVQPAGKKAMAIEEFLRGYPVASGDIFFDEP